MVSSSPQIDFKQLARLIPNPVAVFDADLKVVYTNNCLDELYPELKSAMAIFEQSSLANLTSFGEVEAISLVPGNGSQKVDWRIQRAKDGLFYAHGRIVDADHDTKLLDIIKELNDQKFALDESSIVAITDAKGIITYANRKFSEISGYSKQELLGQNHHILNSGHHSRKFFKELWATIGRGDIWRGEIKNKAKDGSFYWVYTTIVPFSDREGKPYQYVAIRTDVTEGKQAVQLLEEERVRTTYAEKMASLGKMAAGIAHELGNPIAALTTWLDIITEASHNGTLHEIDLSSTLPKVQARAQHMSNIITGMLTFARDGSRDPYEAVNLSYLVRNVIEYCSYELRHGDVVVQNQLEGQNLICQGRQSEISQVFVNLVGNSVDAIRELDDKWIRIEGKDLGDRIEILFRDSGSGIPEAIRSNVFEPFYTSKPTGKGTGLGLSISRTLMREHDGDLEYIPGDNTTFKLIFSKTAQSMPGV